MSQPDTSTGERAGHTPGPLAANGNAVHTQRGACVALAFDPAEVDGQRSTAVVYANARLFAAAPDLYLALKAQAVQSDMQREGRWDILASDPRYTPFIGEWDGVQSARERMHDFIERRRGLREQALAKAEGRQ